MSFKEPNPWKPKLESEETPVNVDSGDDKKELKKLENEDVESEKRLERAKRTLRKMGCELNKEINELPEKAREFLKILTENKSKVIKRMVITALMGMGVIFFPEGGAFILATREIFKKTAENTAKTDVKGLL